MLIELFNQGQHRCLMFCDLAHGQEAVQSNQFLVIDGDTGALIDPGGNLAYNELYMGLTHQLAPHSLSALLASHADPDIIASLDRWLTATTAPVYIPAIWERFIPHLCKAGKTVGRVIGIPDRGQRIRIGDCELVALPAHYMHSEGNFQFWDPTSGILFSGDLGASVAVSPARTIVSLADHVPAMEAFHRRHMASGRILRYWAAMVRTLPVRMIVPQHGCALAGAAVPEFIAWVEGLSCGIDLMSQADYTVPAS
jgi:flavorubredoxin